MASQIRLINKMIEELHDPTLWKPEAGPLENPITRIWYDGEITNEKGGYAYGMRSVFSFHQPVNSDVIGKGTFKWPEYSGDKGYAMVTPENAKTIRDKMVEFANN